MSIQRSVIPNAPAKDSSAAVDKATGFRPWQKAFWNAMIGKCPGKDDAGAPGSAMTPEALWDLACLYFQGEDEDTMVKKDFIRSGENAGKVVEITTLRPFSWNSFDLFMLYHGINTSIHDIRRNKDGKYAAFQDVVARIENVIYEQKFDGAAIGVYSQQLIIRDLGLAEKVDASVRAEQPLFVDTQQEAMASPLVDDMAKDAFSEDALQPPHSTEEDLL